MLCHSRILLTYTVIILLFCNGHKLFSDFHVLNKTFKLSGSKALPTASEKVEVGTAIIKATGTA